jgi:hypothetical protein
MGLDDGVLALGGHNSLTEQTFADNCPISARIENRDIGATNECGIN